MVFDRLHVFCNLDCVEFTYIQGGLQLVYRFVPTFKFSLRKEFLHTNTIHKFILSVRNDELTGRYIIDKVFATPK